MDLTSLTSLPTDSLYKFLAIAGLLILAVAIALPIYLRKNLKLQLIDVKRRIKLVRMRKEFLLKDLERSKDDVARLRKLSESNPKDPAAFNDLSDIIEESLKKQESEGFESECQLEEIGFDIEKLEFLSEEIKRLFYLQFVGIVVGVVMTFSGFTLWYTKVQVYLDQALESAPLSARK